MNHRDVVVALAQHHAWRHGAELGLGRGLLFRGLLGNCPQLHMVGVDMCRHPYMAAMYDAIEAEYEGRCKILRGLASKVADQVKHELDFIFIDTGKGYEGVRDNIARWRWKVRRRGWVMGHDYDPKRDPGVVRAVHEAFGDNVIQLPHTIWVWDHGIGHTYVNMIRQKFA